MAKAPECSGDKRFCKGENDVSVIIKIAHKDGMNIVLNGDVKIKWDEGEIDAQKGDSIFVPAGLKTILTGQAEILYSYV